MCYFDQGRHWDVEVQLQEGECVFLCKDVSQQQTQMSHSNNNEMPSYFFALAGSIRVNDTLLDVMTTEKGGGSCVN